MDQEAAASGRAHKPLGEMLSNLLTLQERAQMIEMPSCFATAACRLYAAIDAQALFTQALFASRCNRFYEC